MKKVIIITGASRGLGKALADYCLKDNNAIIISLSRSIHVDHKNVQDDKLIFIKTDLSKPFLDKIFQRIDLYIKKETDLYFFNNAGIILPIEKIGDFSTDDIDNSLKVNVHYPVNLINYILRNYTENKKIFVNISSGAGERPISTWALYCSAKAYMKMFFKVIEKESEGDNLVLHTIDPGVLDTEMQANIRKIEAPEQAYFQSLKDENKLISPEVPAFRIFEKIDYKI